jgi:hypothetical protein
MSSIQLKEFEWLSFSSLLSKEALDIENFLILANELLPIRLKYIGLALDSFMHLLEHFLKYVSDCRLNRLCILLDLIHFRFDQVQLLSDSLHFLF